jgi:predicted CoA-binding protein
MEPVNPIEILQQTETVLVVDWPSKDVPESLVRAGLRVAVRGGPGPEDYSEYELKGGEVVIRHTGRPPERAELVYSYRPWGELGEIVSTAQKLQAKTLWTQSGLAAEGVKDPKGCWVAEEELETAKKLVHSAGLQLVTEPYIGDVAREIH